MDNLSQYDLDYRVQKKNATKEEYILFLSEHFLNFTKEEMEAIDEAMRKIEEIVRVNDYNNIPKIETITFAKTTQKEECGSLAYTHGNYIYIEGKLLKLNELLRLICHEIFHCITRTNRIFREDMYRIINFTVIKEEFVIPDEVKAKMITNPDVERHDSYATFTINNKKKDCYLVLISTKPYEQKGDNFFRHLQTVLVPVNWEGRYYYSSEAQDFDQILGTNTDFAIDPEECLADNFSFALLYGIKGRNGKGYPNPEIVEDIIDYLKYNSNK